MKKTLFAAVVILAVMAMACQNKGKGGKDNATKEMETQVKQRVEQMIQMRDVFDADKILTTDLYSLQNMAQSVHFWSDFCWGFEWNLGVLDACSEKQEVNIEGVKLIDSLHCDVDMRYVDEGCYNEPYTLHLLKENGEWKINDVTYEDGESTLRDNLKMFYEDMEETYRTTSPEEIMEFMLQEEPSEESYTDPESIYYKNPKAIYELINQLKHCYELFMHNPGYTAEYGDQIEKMIRRIENHI